MAAIRGIPGWRHDTIAQRRAAEGKIDVEIGTATDPEGRTQLIGYAGPGR
jgi:hypothetical protein